MVSLVLGTSPRLLARSASRMPTKQSSARSSMAGWLLMNEEDEISAYGPRNWVKPEEMVKGMGMEGDGCWDIYIYIYIPMRWCKMMENEVQMDFGWQNKYDEAAELAIFSCPWDGVTTDLATASRRIGREQRSWSDGLKVTGLKHHWCVYIYIYIHTYTYIYNMYICI